MSCILRRYLINHISYTLQYILYGELFIDWNWLRSSGDRWWVGKRVHSNEISEIPDRKDSTTRTLLLNVRHYHLISTITLYSTPILNLHPGSSNNLHIMINWFNLFGHFKLFNFIHATLGCLMFYWMWGH